jgi:effector-binding domain-containing protein
MDPLLWDFEICLPVARPIQPAGRVVPGTLRAARVARTVYHGPYEGLPDAWREFDDWIRAQGHAATGEFWEVYLVGPESGAAPAEIQTQLNRPLAGAR